MRFIDNVPPLFAASYHWLGKRWPRVIWILMLALSALVLNRTLEFTRSSEFNRLSDLSTRQLDLYIAALDGELQRYAYLASLLEVDTDVVSALTNSPTQSRKARSDKFLLERKLENIAVRAGVQELFILTPDARILTSSLGADAAPYSSTATGTFTTPDERRAYLLRGQATQWLMSNPDTHAPEYYFSHPIFDATGNQLLGTSVVRISLAPLESAWVDLAFRTDSEKVIVVDEKNTIILSSVLAWKGRDFSARNGIREDHLVHQRLHPQTGWSMMILNNPDVVRHNIKVTMLSTSAALAFLHVLYFYFLLRRNTVLRLTRARNALQAAHDELERKVIERTQDLHDSNQLLKKEMHERQHAEAALLHSNKMAALGQMSAKVAHEISQPLTALQALANNSKILLEKQRLSEVIANMTATSSIVGRMIHMTMQLKTFSRKSRSRGQALRPVDLDAVISNSRTVLSDRLNAESIDLITTTDLPTVLADSIQLEQVFTNLFSNAMDAMENLPADQKKTIRVYCCALESNTRRIVISVQDCGPGISQDVVAHLFEPFYTNKPNGKGLGIGLSISASIISEHGGRLQLDNSANNRQGATFTFDLERA